MSTKNKDILYGEVELDDLEFESRHVKVRITTMIDEDVLVALKKVANSKRQKYQTILNQVLKAFVERKTARRLTPVGETRVREIVREELKKRA